MVERKRPLWQCVDSVDGGLGHLESWYHDRTDLRVWSSWGMSAELQAPAAHHYESFATWLCWCPLTSLSLKKTTLALGGGLITTGCITHIFPLLWVGRKPVVAETPTYRGLEFLFVLLTLWHEVPWWVVIFSSRICPTAVISAWASAFSLFRIDLLSTGPSLWAVTIWACSFAGHHHLLFYWENPL